MLLSLATALLLTTASAGGDAAIVAELEGRARSGDRPLALFDWVTEGTLLQVDEGAATLAFASGRRFRMSAASRARVAADGLTDTAGDVKPLASVPPLPAMPGAMSRSVSEAAGATAVRSLPISWLYPRAGATLAEATVLRWAADGDGLRFRVQVRGFPSGDVVLDTRTSEATFAVPSGVLAPGTLYTWTVRTVESPVALRGDGVFATLAAEQAAARAKLRADSAAGPALLAGVDKGLGLLWEAADTLRAELARSDSPALHRALADLELAVREAN